MTIKPAPEANAAGIGGAAALAAGAGLMVISSPRAR